MRNEKFLALNEIYRIYQDSTVCLHSLDSEFEPFLIQTLVYTSCPSKRDTKRQELETLIDFEVVRIKVQEK